jgi:hypothetical protein
MNAFTSQSHPHQNQANDTRFADLLTTAGKLGKANAKGVASRADLAIHVTTAAAERYLGPKSKTCDDVERVWNRYQEEQGNDRASTKGSHLAQVSKLNAFARLGARGDGDDAVVMITRAREIVNSMDDLKGATFDNMLRVATKQLDTEELFDDDGIRAALSTEQKDPKSELERFKALLKAAERIRDGKQPTEKDPVGEPPCPSEEVETVITAAAARIAVLEMARDDRKARDEEAARKARVEAYMQRMGKFGASRLKDATEGDNAGSMLVAPETTCPGLRAGIEQDLPVPMRDTGEDEIEQAA